MIEKLLRGARIVHQTPDIDGNVQESPIAAYRDSVGTLVLSQEGREIIISRATLKDLFKALRDLKAEAEQEKGA